MQCIFYIFVTNSKHINVEVKELLMFPIVVVCKDVYILSVVFFDIMPPLKGWRNNKTIQYVCNFIQLSKDFFSKLLRISFSS